MSSSSASPSVHGHPEASSSRAGAARQPTATLDQSKEDESLLSEDPLEHALPEQYVQIARISTCEKLRMLTSRRLSFKRKQKAAASSGFAISRFLSSPQPRMSHPRTSPRPNDSTDLILNYLDTPGNAGDHLQDTKDANGMDWYVEGPGRRVGYDDLTAIDWIFEYAKERQRLRHLYSGASGILGYAKQIADASQIWLVLIATGILSGGIAAFIDVVSDWLGDLKTGFCSNVEGDGRFYLNKGFCCWGYSEYAQCKDWHPWSRALGITSVGGGWIVEYMFFLLFSVRLPPSHVPTC